MRKGARTVALLTLLVVSTVVESAPTAAAGSSRAVVNVRGSNAVITFGGSTSGLGALQMAGHRVAYIQYGGQGIAVCSIDGFGNPAVAGQCLGEQGDGSYWSYWRAAPGASGFSYSGQGAGQSTVTDGWVEGWSFGRGSRPPFSSFCAVAGCAPPPTSPPPTVAAATGGGVTGATGGTSTTGAGGGVDGKTSDPATSADGTPRTTTASGNNEDARASNGDDARAAAASNTGAQVDGESDGGSGTPIGVAVASVLVVGMVGAIQWRKRRRTAAG